MKDTWDFVEVEMKVRPDGRHQRLVELAEQAGPAGSRMLRKPHVAFFDVYLDSPSLAFARNEAYLRVRFAKSALRKKGRYKLFFKENRFPTPDMKYLSRREVRSDLSRDEIFDFSHGRLTGAAADLGYAILDRVGEARSLVPICVISSFRRYFTMRTSDPVYTDILNLGLEQSTALPAADLDIKLLLETGFIDAPTGGKRYDFEIAEAELSADVPWAHEMFQRLVPAFAAEFEVVTGSKYITCLEQLGLAADLSR
jgi:hypothetical protein